MVDPTGVILALVCESESPRYHCFQPFLTLHLPRAHGGHKYRFRDANCRDGIAHEFNVAGRRRTLSARVVTERLKLSCIMCQLGAPSHGSSPRSTTGPGVANPVRVDRAKTGCEYNTSRDAYTRQTFLRSRQKATRFWYYIPTGECRFVSGKALLICRKSQKRKLGDSLVSYLGSHERPGRKLF